MNSGSQAPFLKLTALSGGLRSDIAYYWNMAVGSPLRAIAALLAFVGTFNTFLEVVFGNDGDAGTSRTVSLLGPLVEQPSGRLLVFVIAACSIGWTIALITGPLSRSKDDALRILGIVLAGLFGLFLTFMGQHLLLSMAANATRGTSPPAGMAFMLTAAGIAAAVALIRTSYRLTLEADPAIIDRRAALVLVFTLSAVGSAVIVFPMSG